MVGMGEQVTFHFLFLEYCFPGVLQVGATGERPRIYEAGSCVLAENSMNICGP